MASYPYDCVLGKGLYFDGASGPGLSSGWVSDNANLDALPAIEQYSPGRYRYRLIANTFDRHSAKKIIRYLRGVPTIVEADVGISVSEFSTTGGIDSATYVPYATISGYNTSGSIQWRAGIFLRHYHNPFVTKNVSVQIRLMDSGATTHYSTAILDNQIEAIELPYNFEYSARVKVEQTGPTTFAFYINNVLIGSYTDSEFVMIPRIGIDLAQYIAASDATMYGWVDNIRCIGPLASDLTRPAWDPATWAIGAAWSIVAPSTCQQSPGAYTSSAAWLPAIACEGLEVYFQFVTTMGSGSGSVGGYDGHGGIGVYSSNVTGAPNKPSVLNPPVVAGHNTPGGRRIFAWPVSGSALFEKSGLTHSVPYTVNGHFKFTRNGVNWNVEIFMEVVGQAFSQTGTRTAQSYANDQCRIVLLGGVGDSATSGDAVQFTMLRIVSPGMGETCLGPTPDPWPIVNSGIAFNPYACELGKKTSWFLDEYIGPTLRGEWNLLTGVPVFANGFMTVDPEDIVNVLGTFWHGIPLMMSDDGMITVEIQGHVDQLNRLGAGSGRDAVDLTIHNQDETESSRCLLQRDATTATTYHFRTEDAGGNVNQVSFTISYPYTVRIRAEVYEDEVQWFVNDNLIHTYTWATPITRIFPEVAAGTDALHRGYIHYCYIAGVEGFPDLCMGDPASGIARYRNMMINLLPQWLPWRNLNPVFQLFLESFAVESDRVHTGSDDLLREADPARATSALLLSEWEDMALLPEEKPTGAETQSQRQQVVAAKVTNQGGQSRAFFIALAASLGMTIVITEGGTTTLARVGTARVGTARTNDPGNVFIWNIQVTADPNTQLAKFQTMVARLKPAHTSVTYS
jgi:uncharacterized protein YmfQ (DUF2313 family)